jgi:sigma-B regulation protein RsbU (phosphoserine phosphatase)
VVLVVEDEPLVRMLAADIIREASYETIEAANADSAIAIPEARRDIRIVFTDIDMPGSMDGLKLARAMRMSELVDNVLDFARGRLSGVPVEVSLQPVEPVLQQVVNEMRAAWPNRAIETHFALRDEVACDRGRPAQLFSNLLGNALLHGAAAGAVHVTATTDGKVFELSIANSGNPIPPAAMEYLFEPFYRAKVRRTQQGLGLGLYIASEIAKAHGGTLEAQSQGRETRFTFRMPIR